MKSSIPDALQRRAARGFTLLELVIVMVLIGLAMGGAMAFFLSNASERELKGAAGDIELLAKRARSVAMIQQRPYAITFSGHSLRLSPWVEAGLSDREMALAQQQDAERKSQGLASPKFSSIREQVSLNEMEISVKRWAGLDWIPLLRNDPQIWRFDPNGMCEPVAVRVVYDRGWIEMEFHPLTASIRESSMEARR